jgi:lipoprotein-releasing system permease protein
MIGTLKGLGMANSEIRKIFTYRATGVMLRGLVAGNIVALALLLLQQHLHIVKLDEAGYFLSEVPVSLGFWWIAGVNMLFVAIIVLVIHLSTRVVQQIRVADAIKFQ